MLAARADRPFLEGRDRRERADDGVALGGGVPAALAGHVRHEHPEDVGRELLVVAAFEDESIGLVDFRKDGTARAEEEEVGDDVGQAEHLVREPERGSEVVAPEHLGAELLGVLGRAGQEPRRDDVDPESTGPEQVEAATQEIGICPIVAVASIRILRERHVALAIRRVADDELQPSRERVRALRDPPLERPLEQVDVGPQQVQHRGGHGGVFDAVPHQRLEARTGEREGEPADARGGFERVHLAVDRHEFWQPRFDDPRDLGAHRGGVKYA